MPPTSPSRLRRLCQRLGRRGHPLPVVVVGVALMLPSLWGGVQADDVLIRATVRGIHWEDMPRSRWEPFTFLTGRPADNQRLRDLGWLPFWLDVRCRAAFFRPLSALTHMIDHNAWDDYPVLMHAHSLAWYALLLWAAAVLYRRLMGRTLPPWAAVLAALLFALDDGHATPAGWLANRNSVLAGVFGVLALLAYDRWRQDGWRPGAVLAPVALLASLLAKEAAVSVCGYLVAYALLLDPGLRRKRLTALLPCLLVAAAWYATYRMLGFGVSHSDMYVDPGRDPTRFLQRVGMNGPLLLLAQWGLPDSDWSNFWSLGALRMHWAAAVAFLAVLALVLAPMLRRSSLARFWALGAVLAVVPACAAFPSDRLLMFVGLGAAPLLAQFLVTRVAVLPLDASPFAHRASRLAAVLLIACNLVLSPLLLPLKSVSFRFIGSVMTGHYATLPKDEALRDQTLVIVASFMSLADYIWQVPRHESGEPLPRRTLQLNASFSAALLTRTGERTLAVRPRQGYLCPARGVPGQEHLEPTASGKPLHRLFDVMVRSADCPMALGQVVKLPDASVEITELAADGRPAEATFHFEKPLDDPSYRWLRLTAKGYVPFPVPAIGETVHVDSPWK